MQSAECCTSIVLRICAGAVQLGASMPLKPMDAVGGGLQVVLVLLRVLAAAHTNSITKAKAVDASPYFALAPGV